MSILQIVQICHQYGGYLSLYQVSKNADPALGLDTDPDPAAVVLGIWITLKFGSLTYVIE